MKIRILFSAPWGIYLLVFLVFKYQIILLWHTEQQECFAYTWETS